MRVPLIVGFLSQHNFAVNVRDCFYILDKLRSSSKRTALSKEILTPYVVLERGGALTLLAAGCRPAESKSSLR